MNHNEANAALWEFHDGELPPQKRRDVEAHLFNCADCSMALALWQNLSTRLFRAAVPATSLQTEAFTQRVLGRIQRSGLERSFDWARLWSPQWLAPTFAVGLAAAALIVRGGQQAIPDPTEELLQYRPSEEGLLSWIAQPAAPNDEAFSEMVGEG